MPRPAGSRLVMVALVLGALLCPLPAAASCEEIRDVFWRMATRGRAAVVLVQVERHVDFIEDRHISMEVRVLKVLRGEVRHSVVKIWGGLVGPRIEPFVVGSRWAFVLVPDESHPKDFMTGGQCSKYFVPVRQGPKGPGVLEQELVRRFR